MNTFQENGIAHSVEGGVFIRQDWRGRKGFAGWLPPIVGPAHPHGTELKDTSSLRHLLLLYLLAALRRPPREPVESVINSQGVYRTGFPICPSRLLHMLIPFTSSPTVSVISQVQDSH